MEDKHRGTRKRIVRKAGEGHSEKVDFSTSRSFDSEERPARRAYTPHGSKPFAHSEHPQKSRGPRRDGEERPFGERKPRSGYGKPGFGGKSGFSGKPGQKGKSYGKRSGAAEGMSAMLSRKPQVSGKAWSDDDSVKTPIKEIVRLNK